MESPHIVFLDALVAGMVSVLDDNQREAWVERSAIIQFEAKLPRAHAECLALLNILNCYPMALTGVSGIWVEIDGRTGWLFTTDLARARQHLAQLGGQELEPFDLTDVVEKQFGGVVMLTILP